MGHHRNWACLATGTRSNLLSRRLGFAAHTNSSYGPAVALGLGVGAVSGAWNTLLGEGELFFDSLSMLVFFLLVGRAIQSRQQSAACEAVDLLSQLTPATAKRVALDGSIETIAIEQIEKDDFAPGRGRRGRSRQTEC